MNKISYDIHERNTSSILYLWPHFSGFQFLPGEHQGLQALWRNGKQREKKGGFSRYKNQKFIVVSRMELRNSKPEATWISNKNAIIWPTEYNLLDNWKMLDDIIIYTSIYKSKQKLMHYHVPQHHWRWTWTSQLRASVSGCNKKIKQWGKITLELPIQSKNKYLSITSCTEKIQWHTGMQPVVLLDKGTQVEPVKMYSYRVVIDFK